MIFKGGRGVRLLCAEIDWTAPNGPNHRVLRICDFYTKDNGKWIRAGATPRCMRNRWKSN